MSETENLSLEKELLNLIERAAHALGSEAASETIDTAALDQYLRHFCETLRDEFGNEAILERLVDIGIKMIAGDDPEEDAEFLASLHHDYPGLEFELREE